MSRTDALLAALFSAGLMALLAPFATRGVEFHHDGILLKPALDVLSGQVLFRDTFMQYGALTCYLQVLALRIHPTLLAVKFMSVAAYGISLFFFYAAWRMVLPRSLTILSCALFILFIPCYENGWFGHPWIFLPWSSVFAMSFQSVALYALFRIIRGEPSAWWSAILGIACACVFWCRQPVGVITTGCLIVVLIALHYTKWEPTFHSKRSICLRILAGFAAINGFMLANLWLTGSWSAWWYQNFVWPKKFATNMYEDWVYFLTPCVHPAAGAWLLLFFAIISAPFLIGKIRPAFSAGGILICVILLGGWVFWQHDLILRIISLRDGGWASLFPLIILLQVVVSLALAFMSGRNAKTTDYYLVAAWSVLSLGSLLQYYPVTDVWHVMWSLAPSFGLFVFVFWRCFRWPSWVLVLIFAVIFSPSIGAKIKLIAQSLARPTETLVRPAVLRGIKVPKERARVIEQIADTVEKAAQYRPDLPSVLVGNDAMYLCFTTEHTNPTPYFVTWTQLPEPGDAEKRRHYIMNVRPMVFLQNLDAAAIREFCAQTKYVSVTSIPEDHLEIALPQEIIALMSH